MSEQIPVAPSRFKVYVAAPGQLFNSGVTTQIHYNTKLYDGLDEFDIATYVFTPRRAGYYLLISQFRLVPIAGNDQKIQTVQTMAGVVLAQSRNHMNNGLPTDLTTSTIEYLTPNESVEVTMDQISGLNVNCVGGPESTFFTAHRLS